MKVMILAGGFGTRISEESVVRPKPMVEIGNMPILWHIMKIYSCHGFRDFVICCGYKGHMIKDWFDNYVLRGSDVTYDLEAGTREIHLNRVEPWRVTLVDTGLDSMTGGRIRIASKYIEEDEFFLTYGDGVSDVDIGRLLAFHKDRGALVTMTAVQPEGRFGVFQLEADETKVTSFREKPKGDSAWVNGGFFVVKKQAVDYIKGPDTVWEREPLQALAAGGELSAFRHLGFWLPMDTLRDRNVLEEIWQSGEAPWKIW